MTPERKKALELVTEMIVHIGRAIRELKEIPSGRLYARLMEVMSLEDYNAIITKLESANLIKVENHVIIWIGD